MYATLRRPPSKCFAPYPEYHTATTTKGRHGHVRHKGRDVPCLLHPRSDELGDAVAPQVLIHCDRDENRPGCGFVRVDGIGSRDGWKGGDLYAGASETKYDDDLRFSVSESYGENTHARLTLQSHKCWSPNATTKLPRTMINT